MGSKELLDHGYVKFIEHWGSDERIIEAARMSTDKGFRSWSAYYECKECNEWYILGGWKVDNSLLDCGHAASRYVGKGDMGLLSYLYNNKHATPFEMAGMVIEVQAPIFVFREWHRHRTQSYNELSARYTPLPDLNYIPTVERLMLNSKTNKQAGVVAGAEEMTEEYAEIYIAMLEVMYSEQESLYQIALRRGVPKELARIHLPVARYSRMRASANLRNWLAFLTLRQDPKAQWEIRQYANALNMLLVDKFPRTMELFNATPNV